MDNEENTYRSSYKMKFKIVKIESLVNEKEKINVPLQLKESGTGDLFGTGKLNNESIPNSYFYLKLRYDFSQLLSKNKSQIININKTVNETYLDKTKNMIKEVESKEDEDDTPNINVSSVNQLFSTNNIKVVPLSLNIEKIFKIANENKLKYKENEQQVCLFTLIKNRNAFISIFNWSNLNNDRFDRIHSDNRLSGDRDNKGLKSPNKFSDVGSLRKSIKNDDSIHNQESNENLSEMDENENELQNSSGQTDEIEEDPVKILDEEIEANLKREVLFDKISKIKNYSKNVKCYIIRNELDPKEEKLDPKILETAYLVNSTDFSIEEINNNSNQLTSNIKLSKETNEIKEPKSLGRLEFVSYIILSILIIYAVVELILNTSIKSILVKNFEMSYYSFKFNDEMQWSNFFLRNLITTEENKNIGVTNSTIYETYFNGNVTNIKNSIVTQNYIILNLTKIDFNLNERHKQILTTQIVPIYSLDLFPTISIKNRTLIEAMTELRIILVNIIENNSRSDIRQTNTFILNYIFNLLKDFTDFSYENAIAYNNLISKIQDTWIIVFSVYFGIFIVLSIIFTYIIYYLISKVDEDRTKILVAFYEIPHSYLNKLTEQCLNYVEKQERINKNNNSDVQEDDDVQNNDNQLIPNKLNKKKISNYMKNQIFYLYRITIIFLILLVFFCINFVKNILMLKNSVKINEMYNNTLTFMSKSVYSLNIQREKIFYSDTEYLKVMQTDGLLIVNNTLNDLVDLNAIIFENNIKKQNLLSTKYNDVFKSIMYGDLCLNKIYIENDCRKNVKGLGKYGLQTILIEYFKNLDRFLRFELKRVVKKSRKEISNLDLLVETNNILYYFIRNSFQIMVEELKLEIQNNLNNDFQFKLIVFIIFCVVTLLSFLIFWLPYQSNMKEEILRKRKMLEIIPSYILNEIDFINEI